MRRKTKLKAITALQAATLAVLAIFGAFTAQGNAKQCKPVLSASAPAGSTASACYLPLSETR